MEAEYPIYCGQCGLGFETAEDELAHICEITGYAPTDPRSMGPNWEAIQQAALARGAEE